MRVWLPLFLFIALLGSVVPVYAQSVAPVEPLTVVFSPQYPTPYQKITLVPSSTLFDIAASTITVTVNGTPLYKGSGGQSVDVTLGGPGTVTNITVTAVAAGQTYTQKVTIRPASVALVVEPVSTTFPFYKGRGLVGSEGDVRLIAVPDLRTSSGQAVDPSKLVYTWNLGDKILQSDSGIGKNVLSASAPVRYRDADIILTVQTQDQSIVAQAETIVTPVDPFVRIYRNDPLLGPLFDIALSGAISLNGSEDTYRGVPYYFSETPALNWTVNGNDSGTSPDITVRATGNGQGTARLGFAASQSDTHQSADSALSILFGNKQSLGIFGL
jgi:hypothetical protein